MGKEGNAQVSVKVSGLPRMLFMLEQHLMRPVSLYIIGEIFSTKEFSLNFNTPLISLVEHYLAVRFLSTSSTFGAIHEILSPVSENRVLKTIGKSYSLCIHKFHSPEQNQTQKVTLNLS